MMTKKKATKKKAAKKKDQAVVVTTKHRGVFFGYTEDIKADPIFLRQARMCVRWSRDVKGVPGLAGNGPTDGCRISPAADGLFRDVTAVMIATAEAAKRWESQPWSN